MKIRILYDTYARQERFGERPDGEPFRDRIEAVSVEIDGETYEACPCRRDADGRIAEVELLWL